MAEKLSTLADNLDTDQFFHVKKFFTDQELPLVRRKGVFPYEYLDSIEKLNERELPCKRAFYNTMTYSNVSDEDYHHAEQIWRTFNIQTLGDYSDFYLKIDVLLLSDIFETFRAMCLSSYKLDCAYYLTLPSYTFDAMLLYTNIEVELLHDYDKYLFIENGIRGGIAVCVKKHAMANNPYVTDTFDPTLQKSFLLNLDANNLYGWAMSQYLPYKNFEWWVPNPGFDVTKIPDDSDVGYFLEVDVEYPKNLHDYHNDLPFLSISQKPPGSKYPKLLTTLENKTSYICHYRVLKQAINNGLVLLKIRRVLRFNQAPWLQPYIAFNTAKRQAAKNSFEKDLFKKSINSLFGKTMENIRKRLNLQLVSDPKKFEKLVSKTGFVSSIVYEEFLAAVQMAKTKVIFDKPIFIGFTVLELSKWLMYSFHYDVMKRKYGENICICYMDTDSFFYHVFTDDIYKDIKENLTEYFDTSDYPDSHYLKSLVNKKVLGKFKDELNSIPISEFIGLRAKLYTFKIFVDESSKKCIKDKEIIKKAKGINYATVKNKITFEDYKECLFSETRDYQNDPKWYRHNINFLSKHHEIRTITTFKLALSANDDKRVTKPDERFSTYAYGHYKLL
jgi:hypothetical protein